jgi:arylsulfatase A-like enzyme
MLDYLQESGQLVNTLIVLVSDNGASGEGGPNGSVNENKFFNGIPDTTQDNLKYLDVLGSPLTYNQLPDRLGLGVQHAVQAVEALRQLPGRHGRPDDRLLAQADQDGGHPAPVHARDRHRPDDL